MGDSSTMFLDSVTYALNYWLEKQRQKGKRSETNLMWIEIYVSGTSVMILLGVCVVFLIMAIERIATYERSDDEEVDAPVVLAFASVNLVFDILSTVMFILDRRHLVNKENEIQMNFCSAFMHILADFMRTLSELAASTFVVAFGTDSVLTDAWCAIVVEVRSYLLVRTSAAARRPLTIDNTSFAQIFIFVPAIYVSWELVSRVRRLRSGHVQIEDDSVSEESDTYHAPLVDASLTTSETVDISVNSGDPSVLSIQEGKFSGSPEVAPVSSELSALVENDGARS